MINLLKNSLFILSSFLLLFGCSTNKRVPANLEQQKELNQIVISKLSIRDGKNFYLIGQKCTTSQLSCYEWSKEGFKVIEGNSERYEAKFLLSYNNKLVEDIYSFEYGNTNKKKIIIKKDEEGQSYSSIKLPKRLKAKLPKHFLNITEVKRQRRPYSLINYFLRAVNFTPLSAFSSSIQEIIELIENKKVFQSVYLSRVVELMLLDNRYPNFMKEIGRDGAVSIGSALRMRFRNQITGVTASLGTNQEESKLYYQKHLEFKTEVQSINMGKLTQRANEENLVVEVVSRDLAILLYDPNSEMHVNGYDDLLLNTRKSLKEYNGTKLVALGVFTTIDSAGPTKVVDFERSKNPIKNERITKFLDFGVGLGLSFISSNYITTPLNVGNFFTKLVLKKSGKVYQKNLIESEATLKALLDSGVIELDPQEVSVKYFLTFLKESGYDSASISSLEKRLNSKNQKTIKEAMNEVIESFQEQQTSRRSLSGLKNKKKIANRIVATEQFKKFLSSDLKVNKFVHAMNKKRNKVLKRQARKKKRLARKLIRKQKRTDRREMRAAKRAIKKAKKMDSIVYDQENTNSAIVFMIDGLRPDRLKEAVGKGLMPNLKKYFYTHGIEFNSFTTKSLTLPSWSSVLTGYDIDTHGVRSNGPMNRVKAKPQDNYIDPRKDFIFGKNRAQSRSLQHLKESGLKWLPDYFGPNETVTNYLPINEGVFPAVGKLMKGLVKDYDEFLFGSFSGSMALDKAGALRTAQKIKKNPGATKLVVNWYTCVDVFAHHNNIAIDRCYSELDKTLKIVLDAAKKDIVLKNAHLFIVSDHGHSGGHESHASEYKLFEQGSYFNNTGLNLTTLFAGDYANYSYFDFYPFVMESPHIDNDLKFLGEYQLHPFRYKYKSRKKKFKNRTPEVMIDYSGDSLAQVYLKDPVRGWGEKLDFSTLSNINGRNLLEDLLNVKVRNYAIYDKKTKKKIDEMTKGYPIMAYAHSLNSCSDEDIKSIVGEEFKMDRPAVIVKGLTSKFGMVITKKIEGQIHYKYHLLDTFKQGTNKKCSGVLSEDSSNDILNQHHLIKGEWNSKVGFVQKMKETRFPTSLVSLVANLTLNENLLENKDRVAEIPDFILLANLGFNFNSAAITEADHGNLTKRESNNTFLYSNMNLKEFSSREKKELKEKVILNYYLTPFVLDVTKRHTEKRDPAWPKIEEFINP